MFANANNNGNANYNGASFRDAGGGIRPLLNNPRDAIRRRA